VLRRPTGDGGAIAVLTAIFAVVVFGLAAVIVDLGDARQLRARAQDTVDAASLAGANAVAEGATTSQAAQAVKDSAAENAGTTSAEWSSCGVAVPAGWAPRGSFTSCILFRPASGPPDRIQVFLPVRRTLGAFSGIYGSSGIDYNAVARAQIRGAPVPGCGLCVLDDLDTNGSVTVTGGDSFAASTGQVGGAGSVAVASPGIVAFASTPSPATGPYSPDPVVGTPTDALASAPRPAFPATPAPTDTVVCGPSGVSSLPSAVYQDIEVRGPCTTSGVLTVTRQLRVFGAGRLTSVGATIHLTCGSRTAPTVCPPDTTNRGWIRVDVGGVLTIAGPTASRFSVVADPGNARDLRVSGTVTLDRALYARSVELDIRTNGALSVSDITVANDLTVASGGAVTVDSSGATPVLGPLDVRLAR
jgi:hypothetical protein